MRAIRLTCLVTLLLGLAITLGAAKEAMGVDWVGNYTDKNFLKGQAVFQLNIFQEGDKLKVDFDAVYNDGHGCAPQADGPAKVIDKDTISFTFKDSSGNTGTGTIKRAGVDRIISIKTTHAADPRCIVFYQENIRLKPAMKGRH